MTVREVIIYRAEKRDCKIEYFHSRSVNGVKQELFAAAITMVIAQTLKAIAAPPRVTAKCIVFAQKLYLFTSFNYSSRWIFDLRITFERKKTSIIWQLMFGTPCVNELGPNIA